MITPLYAGLCGILLLALSSRVVNGRRVHKVGLGDGGNEELQRLIRVQANFVEYTPMILVPILLVELNDNSAAVVHGLGIALVLSRVLHAVGLTGSAGATLPRFIGTLGTWLTLAIASSILLMDTLPQ